jgi:hypothetical protein
MTVATTLAPKPVRKRRTRAKSVTPKKMIEQTKVTPIKDTIVPIVVNKVELTKPEVDLISLQSYVDDFNNRMKIHNYELQEAFRDLNKVVTYLRPYTEQVVNKVKDLAR